MKQVLRVYCQAVTVRTLIFEWKFRIYLNLENQIELLLIHKHQTSEWKRHTDIDWSTDNGANPLLDSIYTLASAAEIIRKPTTKTPRQTKNKKKSLGQRDNDHSGDYQNNNELYYGPSM